MLLSTHAPAILLDSPMDSMVKTTPDSLLLGVWGPRSTLQVRLVSLGLVEGESSTTVCSLIFTDLPHCRVMYTANEYMNTNWNLCNYDNNTITLFISFNVVNKYTGDWRTWFTAYFYVIKVQPQKRLFVNFYGKVFTGWPYIFNISLFSPNGFSFI